MVDHHNSVILNTDIMERCLNVKLVISTISKCMTEVSCLAL